MANCGTILVVDHDDAARAAAADVVVRLGYRPVEAENAALAPQYLPDRPALALVEVELPGATSGLRAPPRAARHLR